MQEINEAWNKYSQKLLAFIQSRVSSIEDAEDILAQAFSKLIISVNDNKLPNNLSSWLYHVAKNNIIDYYRTRKIFLELPEYIIEETEDKNVIQELSDCLIPMIKMLPDTYQSAVSLSEIEEKKHKDIALELGLSLSATKSRIQRGRKILHQNLLNCCTFQKNTKGNIEGYEKKKESFCNSC